jgi:hypothetical protein
MGQESPVVTSMVIPPSGGKEAGVLRFARLLPRVDERREVDRILPCDWHDWLGTLHFEIVVVSIRANPMILPSHRWMLRLRAACLASALGVCWASGPATLAADSPDVCSMSCCVKEGQCCCSPRHAYVEGQLPDGRESIRPSSLSVPCPGGCTTSRFSPRFSQGDDSRAAAARLDLYERPVLNDDAIPVRHTADESGPSNPRAPPVF